MDLAILDAIQSHLRSPFMDGLMVFATHLGDFGLIWLIAAIILIAQPKRRLYGIAVILALAFAVVAGSLILKPLFGRLRPFDAVGGFPLLIPIPSGDSFPSNHSMASFAAATALCCLPQSTRGVLVVKIGAVAAACLIAFSRLYLYVHYPSDILIGAFIGIALGFAAVALAKRLIPDAPPGASH